MKRMEMPCSLSLLSSRVFGLLEGLGVSWRGGAFIVSGINQKKQQQQLGKMAVNQKQGFLLPVSQCEFNVTTTIDEIHSSLQAKLGHRSQRCIGAAISAALGLLEGCFVSTSTRIMVFTSGPATLGPGIIVFSDHSKSIRTHRDLINGHTTYYSRSCGFYSLVSQRLTDASVILDLFACSLDQAGVAELKVPVERSGGFMMLGELFASNQFRQCLHHIFACDEGGYLKMYFNTTIEKPRITNTINNQVETKSK